MIERITHGWHLFGWLPVLGWGTVVLALGMIAGEFYPLARSMDRLEVRSRRLFGPLAKTLRRLPAWARLCVSLMIAASTAKVAGQRS